MKKCRVSYSFLQYFKCKNNILVILCKPKKSDTILKNEAEITCYAIEVPSDVSKSAREKAVVFHCSSEYVQQSKNKVCFSRCQVITQFAPFSFCLIKI